MGKKIIKFKQDTDSLIKRANVKYDKGDYPAALAFLVKAQKALPDDTDIALEIALLYGEMGLFDYQLKELIKLLSKGRRDSEVYKELIKCYFEMDLYEQAFYFYKEAMDSGILDDDNLDELLEFDYDGDYSDIRLRDNRDNASLLQLSHKLMLSGDLDFAKQLMETISTDSYQYIDAINSLAVIALASENAQKAIDYSQKALKLDDENVYAIAHSIIAYDLINDNENKQEYIDRLFNLDLSKTNELSVAAFSMQKIRNNELAMFFLEKLIRIAPYTREHLIAAAVASSNCGNKQHARELLVRANNIYPNDIVIAYYSSLIIGSEEKTDLEILSMLPQNVINEWLLELESFVKQKCAVKGGQKNISDDLRDKILWAFQSGDWRIQAMLGTYLVRYPEWERYIRGLLIDPYFDYRAKKECLQALLTSAKIKDFELFITDMYLNFEPKIPRGIYPEEMRRAYWQVYTTLAFIGSNFDNKLNKAFKQLIQCYNNEQFVRFKIDSRPMSALLLFRVNMRHVFKNKIDCCEVFSCDLTDFEVYNDIFFIESDEKKRKTKNISKS